MFQTAGYPKPLGEDDDPDALTEYCIAILRRWHQEIFYRHKHNRIAYDGYIIKALSHSALKDDAYYIARKMLGTEARSLGFLSPELCVGRQKT